MIYGHGTGRVCDQWFRLWIKPLPCGLLSGSRWIADDKLMDKGEIGALGAQIDKLQEIKWETFQIGRPISRSDRLFRV
jgi:hypothetical protein